MCARGHMCTIADAVCDTPAPCPRPAMARETLREHDSRRAAGSLCLPGGPGGGGGATTAPTLPQPVRLAHPPAINCADKLDMRRVLYFCSSPRWGKQRIMRPGCLCGMLGWACRRLPVIAFSAGRRGADSLLGSLLALGCLLPACVPIWLAVLHAAIREFWFHLLADPPVLLLTDCRVV
eukprot:14641682-Alexandrium_andersonii.AAC.1